MESLSSSPVEFISSKAADNSLISSPRLGDISTSEQESENSTRTGLVSTPNGHRRSYGTVGGKLSSSFKRQHTFMIQHTLEGGDTLQGLALKYGVSVHDIEKANGVWNSDSMFCKRSLRIPVIFNTNNMSLSNSPNRSPDHTSTRSMSKASHVDAFLTRPEEDPRMTDYRERSGDEIRSELVTGRDRMRSREDVTAKCGEDGVKSIVDILNCADVQLQISRSFVEKLAKRSDLLNVPRDAYHRTHRDSSWTSSSSPVPEKRDSERENSPRSRRLHRKRVESTPEKLEASHNKLEENFFEL